MFSVDAKISLNLLKNYPTPDLINNATEEELYKLMDTGKGHYTREDAVKLKEAAKDTIGIPDPDGIYAYRIIMNAERLESEKDRMKRIESEIARRFSKNSDIERIAEIKGVSRLAASAIVSEIGNIGQFSSPEKLQAYGGKAPDISGSGGSTHATGVTRTRNPHLSSAIYESAVSLVANRSPEFSEIFAREIRKGKKPTQAYIVVGKRLLYHVYSIMKNHKQYRERLPLMEGTVSTQTSL
jgi:transposase